MISLVLMIGVHIGGSRSYLAESNSSKKKEKKVEEFRHFSKTVLRVLLIVRTDITLMNSKTNH
jgi:hypothetical protein